MKSSIGWHTFTISKRLSAGDENSLDSDFIGYMRETDLIKKLDKGKIGKSFFKEYVYKNVTGIEWKLLNIDVGKNFRRYFLKAKITPKVLLNSDYISIGNESDNIKTKAAFNNEADKISTIAEGFDLYSMNRCDYCANLYLDELRIPCSSKQMMKLLKRADIPTIFTEWKKYDPTSHRKKPGEDSFYLKNKSVNVNCYDKYAQLMNDPNHRCQNKEDAKNLIRFEVQCKYLKLYAMSKNQMQVETDIESSVPKFSSELEMEAFYNDPFHFQRVTLPIDSFLSDTISVEVIDKYFRRIIRSGDYYTLAKAKHIIESSDYSHKKKEKLIKAVERTNRCRGIYNAKLGLTDKDLLDYKQQINDLDIIGVNPVTIPRDWGIEHIPNLLNAYYDKCAEVQDEETLQRLMERFAKHNKKGKKFKKKHIFPSLH
jgi:hypothetical protein